MKFDKKGDVNWFIVSLIIVIVSLVVIVMIFLRFNFGADTDRIACMESAVVRASLGSNVDAATDIVPLSCKTKRICVTTNSKGNCQKDFGTKYDSYRLTGNQAAMENQIKMVLAREMADCWNMLGEGNLKIFSREITSNTVNGKIVVCSRVMFDDSVTKTISSVSGMNNYLISHKVPGKEISYWDYFRNANDGDTLQMLNGNAVVGSTINDNLNLTQQKAVFYLESSVSDLGGALGAFTGVAASTLLLGSFGGAGAKGAAFLGKLATGSTVAGAVAGNVAVLGVAGTLGWGIGDKFFSSYVAPGLEKGDSVSGVFLTDYSVQGFQSFESQKVEFENIP